MKIRLFAIIIFSIFQFNLCLAQTEYLEKYRRDFSIVNVFENISCQDVRNDTMKMESKLPFFFRTTIVQGTLVMRDWHQFEIYFQESETAKLYKVRSGSVRGVSLSFPMDDTGIYWVRYFSHYPCLMRVDNRQSDIYINWRAGCNILHN